ncbi:MAG TPA: carboxypeptidase regulatory-like domain-containing protein [Gemmatimonadaceae bacterium]|nr:carboxypeptidase regulatory-like domain-containing protein [Gemmatimonadaceae bacterium]
MACPLAVCIFAVSIVANSLAGAQGTVLHATIADARTGNYILDAEVTVDPLGAKGITDYFGDARFSGLRKGRYSVHARRIGFTPVSTEFQASGRDSLEVTMFMAPTAQELATVTVNADAVSPFLREFEARRRLGKGQYITDSVLRASLGIPLEDILAARLRGVMVARLADGSFVPFSGRGDNTIGKRCDISVYWNGIRITSPSNEIAIDIPAAFIGGIEFYNPGSIPVEYQDPGSGCGVLLLWPRP